MLAILVSLEELKPSPNCESVERDTPTERREPSQKSVRLHPTNECLVFIRSLILDAKYLLSLKCIRSEISFFNTIPKFEPRLKKIGDFITPD